jgi:hypothetical protein
MKQIKRKTIIVYTSAAFALACLSINIANAEPNRGDINKEYNARSQSRDYSSTNARRQTTEPVELSRPNREQIKEYNNYLFGKKSDSNNSNPPKYNAPSPTNPPRSETPNIVRDNQNTENSRRYADTGRNNERKQEYRPPNNYERPNNSERQREYQKREEYRARDYYENRNYNYGYNNHNRHYNNYRYNNYRYDFSSRSGRNYWGPYGNWYDWSPAWGDPSLYARRWGFDEYRPGRGWRRGNVWYSHPRHWSDWGGWYSFYISNGIFGFSYSNNYDPSYSRYGNQCIRLETSEGTYGRREIYSFIACQNRWGQYEEIHGTREFLGYSN